MLPNLKKILFATDLSKNSRIAFNYAVSIANRYGATVTLLHVLEEVSHAADALIKDHLGEQKWLELKKSREQEARQILIGKKKEGAMIKEALKAFCEEIKADLGEVRFTADEIVVSGGNVVDEILAEAKNRESDLIVMGYHLRSLVEEAVLGSTTRRLLRRSKIPVMLVQLVEEEG